MYSVMRRAFILIVAVSLSIISIAQEKEMQGR